VDDGIGVNAGSTNATGYQSFYDIGSCKTLDNVTLPSPEFGLLN
jgi:hypothetical protein